MEQYKQIKDSLRNEVETQIPKQARIAYLSNRLEQLTDDLHRSYREYESVRKELSKNQETSGLDRSIRDAIAASMPARRIQESRNVYMISLVILVFVFSFSPFGLDNYFRIVGNSVNFTVAPLITVMLAGALVLIPVWLLFLSFIPNNNSGLLRLRKLHPISKIALLACPVLISAAGEAAGFTLWDHAGYEYWVQGPDLRKAFL